MKDVKTFDAYKSDHIQTYKASTGDANYCVLAALHFVTGQPMEICNKFFMRHGRRYRKGMLTKEVEEALSKSKHYYFKKGTYDRNNKITINQFVKKHPVGKYYLIVRGHALAVIDGVVYDHSVRLTRRVYTAFRVYSPEEVAILRKR
jgi:hypothetical protein